MTEADMLLLACIAVPTDESRRLILADKVQEDGDEELAAILRGPDGEECVRRVYSVADTLKRPPDIKLLWAVAILTMGYALVKSQAYPGLQWAAAAPPALSYYEGEAALKNAYGTWKMTEDLRSFLGLPKPEDGK
jgi:hypothetical protein